MSGPIGNAQSQPLAGPRNNIGVSYVVPITIGDPRSWKLGDARDRARELARGVGQYIKDRSPQ